MEAQHHPEQGNNAGAADRRRAIDVSQDEESKNQEDAMVEDLETKNKNEGQHTLMEELQRTRSHSSSSSEEEVEEGGERKKRKKKGLKEKIKEKLSGEKGEANEQNAKPVVMEECNEAGKAEAEKHEENKGLLDKIKEKLPGHHKTTEQGTPTAEAVEHSPPAEKKGILDKIKEKLPGQHKTDA